VNLKCVEAGLCDILNSSSSVHFKFIGPADRILTINPHLSTSMPTETKEEFDAITNILKPFPAITKQIETCEELVRLTRGMKMHHFHTTFIAKWKLFRKCVNDKNITESNLGPFEAFLQTKIAEYTEKHEMMRAEGLPYKPRDVKFVPRYFELAKEHLQGNYTYEELNEHISYPKRQCPISEDLLTACDAIFLTRYPNTYKTIDALYHVRKNSKPCSAKKLIEYALKDHPGRPRETVTPGSDGLSILAAAASLADEAPAAEESRFEETAALSSIEQGVWSLQLDPTELDGTESGGFGSAQPESPRTEGELRCCPSLPLPNATSSPAAASPPPLGELRPDILLAPPPPAPAPPTRAAPRPR
jgi:hypothetical protein